LISVSALTIALPNECVCHVNAFVMTLSQATFGEREAKASDHPILGNYPDTTLSRLQVLEVSE
jgi:hypothetical protein